MSTGSEVRAWRPSVPGVTEVFHARFTDHVYPMHTHGAWTLLVVDSGAVRYDLDRHEHGAPRDIVTLLPPHVPHNGHAVTEHGFRKRVVYLDSTALDDRLVGRAVDRPELNDPALRRHIDRLHHIMSAPGDELCAESLLSMVLQRTHHHLARRIEPWVRVRDPAIADQLRDLLDSRLVEGITLEEASRLLHCHPAHLVRAFAGRFGLPPHRYLTGRRVDLARRLLLEGVPARRVAQDAGFYDQAHLSRHFGQILGVAPGRYARSGVVNVT